MKTFKMLIKVSSKLLILPDQQWKNISTNEYTSGAVPRERVNVSEV